jgi:hypothetical protein
MTEQEKERAVEEIEVSMEQARAAIQRKERLLRLMENQDFKDIILEGYFEKEPARLVSLLRDSSFQSAEDQQSIIDDMKGISSLRQYLRTVHQLGQQMEVTLKAQQQTVESLQNEEDEE